MHVAQVREQLVLLQAACQEVQGSQLLIQLLQAVLGVGNYLNQGTFKGNAPGSALPSPTGHACCHLALYLVQPALQILRGC